MDDTVDPLVLCEVKIEPSEEIEFVEVKQESTDEDSEDEIDIKDEPIIKKSNEDAPLLNTEDPITRKMKKKQIETNHKNIDSKLTTKKIYEKYIKIMNEKDCKTSEKININNKIDKNNIGLDQNINNSIENQQKKFSKTTKRRKPIEKRFQCSTCEKSFNRNSSLIKHIRTHTGEKPFQCTYCQKCFSEKCNLEIHTRIHTGIKPHQCTVCQKSFNQKVDLKRHLRIHTGDKPFLCNTCKKCFNTKCNLDAHIRIHTKEKPYQCNICKKTFLKNSCLLTHKLTHNQ